MTRPLILTGVQIDAILWRLVSGQLGLHEIPSPLASWYWAGSRDADISSPRIAELERDLAIANQAADEWYLKAHHTPQEIEEMRIAAMDDGWRDLWNERVAAHAE